MDVHEVTKAKWIKDYVLELSFSDGKKGQVNLEEYLDRGIFRDLKNPEKFKAFRVDAELGTVVWPNGADIDPETLYRDLLRSSKSDSISDAA